jgi:hypothetical protein
MDECKIGISLPKYGNVIVLSEQVSSPHLLTSSEYPKKGKKVSQQNIYVVLQFTIFFEKQTSFNPSQDHSHRTLALNQRVKFRRR